MLYWREKIKLSVEPKWLIRRFVDCTDQVRTFIDL